MPLCFHSLCLGLCDAKTRRLRCLLMAGQLVQLSIIPLMNLKTRHVLCYRQLDFCSGSDSPCLCRSFVSSHDLEVNSTPPPLPPPSPWLMSILDLPGATFISIMRRHPFCCLLYDWVEYILTLVLPVVHANLF